MEVLWWQSGASSHANALLVTPPPYSFNSTTSWVYITLDSTNLFQTKPNITRIMSPAPFTWCSNSIHSEIDRTCPLVHILWPLRGGNMHIITFKTSSLLSCIMLIFLSHILFLQQSSWFLSKSSRRWSQWYLIWHTWHPYFPWTMNKREE